MAYTFFGENTDGGRLFEFLERVLVGSFCVDMLHSEFVATDWALPRLTCVDFFPYFLWLHLLFLQRNDLLFGRRG